MMMKQRMVTKRDGRIRVQFSKLSALFLFPTPMDAPRMTLGVDRGLFNALFINTLNIMLDLQESLYEPMRRERIQDILIEMNERLRKEIIPGTEHHSWNPFSSVPEDGKGSPSIQAPPPPPQMSIDSDSDRDGDGYEDEYDEDDDGIVGKKADIIAAVGDFVIHHARVARAFEELVDEISAKTTGGTKQWIELRESLQKQGNTPLRKLIREIDITDRNHVVR